jgi:outer membrane lipoprotein-sorting protein
MSHETRMLGSLMTARAHYSIMAPLVATLAAALSACAEMPATPGTSAADAPDIARIQTYLNGLPRLEAHFVQTGDYGPGAGTIWLDRPGHLRIDYQGAASRVMVANAGHLTVYDRATHSTTTVALSRTPLGMLLTPQIALEGAVTITGLQHADGFEQISLVKTTNPDQGTLRLLFRTQPMALDSVTVVDAYHRTLTMALSDLQTDPPINAALFEPPSAAAGS